MSLVSGAMASGVATAWASGRGTAVSAARSGATLTAHTFASPSLLSLALSAGFAAAVGSSVSTYALTLHGGAPLRFEGAGVLGYVRADELYEVAVDGVYVADSAALGRVVYDPVSYPTRVIPSEFVSNTGDKLEVRINGASYVGHAVLQLGKGAIIDQCRLEVLQRVSGVYEGGYIVARRTTRTWRRR